MKKYNFFNLILIIIFILFSTLAISEQISMSGKVTADVPSNVTIANYLAIDFSSELASGIVFENVKFLPAVNVNAVQNYNDTLNGTKYFVRISPDGNTPIDVCVRASGDLGSVGGDFIPLSGESYAYSNFSNDTIPDISDKIIFNTGYSVAGVNVPVGEKDYMRFWLDVPASQPAGEYNNSIYFKGIASGVGC